MKIFQKLFQKKNNCIDLIRDIDYNLSLIEDKTVMKILRGEFSGVKVIYDKVYITDNVDSAVLSFDYEILDIQYKELRNSLKFKNHLGDILLSILTSAELENERIESEPDYIEESKL